MKKIKVSRKHYKQIVYAYRVLVFIGIIATLFAYSHFVHKALEFILILSPYLITKGLYPYQYHANSTKLCFITSIVIFALLITIIIPTEYPITIATYVGLSVAYISCLIGRLQYRANYKPKPFNTDTCSEDELLLRCKELHFSEENCNLAVEFFIKKTKHSVIANQLCIEEKSVTTRKKRMKLLLNKQ